MGGFGSDFGQDFGFEQGASTPASSATAIPSIERLMRTPLVDPQTGFPTKDWMRYLRYNHQRVAGTLDLQGIFTKRNSQDNLIDGSTYARVVATALTQNQVDPSKSGFLGNMPSAKLINNVQSNFSNNATVDSVDNGTNATIRVYGSAGGPGTAWNQLLGLTVGPNLPSFSGAFAYNTDYNVWYDGAAFHVSTSASGSLADGFPFAGSLHTVSAGGTGGTGGGGGAGGGGGGGAGARK